MKTIKIFITIIALIAISIAITSCTRKSFESRGSAKIIKEGAVIEFFSESINYNNDLYTDVEKGDTIFLKTKENIDVWFIEKLPVELMRDTTFIEDGKKISIRRSVAMSRVLCHE